MQKKLILPLFILLVGGTGWYLHYFSDKEVIRRSFQDMTISLAKEGEETPIQVALKMRPVQDFMAPVCEVFIPENSYRETMDPGLAINYLIYYRARQITLQIIIDEISIKITDKTTATADILVHITANRSQPQFFDEKHQTQFSLVKDNKKWRVRQATLPQALVFRATGHP